jgi:hypothetical protein
MTTSDEAVPTRAGIAVMLGIGGNILLMAVLNEGAVLRASSVFTRSSADALVVVIALS